MTRCNIIKTKGVTGYALLSGGEVNPQGLSLGVYNKKTPESPLYKGFSGVIPLIANIY